MPPEVPLADLSRKELSPSSIARGRMKLGLVFAQIIGALFALGGAVFANGGFRVTDSYEHCSTR